MINKEISASFRLTLFSGYKFSNDSIRTAVNVLLDYLEASFSLNQGMVSNWVKGGENNISTAVDLTWFAD